MAKTPRNLRTKTPRPMSLPRRSSPGLLLSPSAWAGPSTPTPPPVTVEPPRRSKAPEVEPSAPSPAARVGAWALLPLLITACLATAIAWRTLDVSEWITPRLTTEVSSKHGSALLAKPSEATPTPATTAKPSKPATGWTIRHDGHVPIPGGVLLLPPGFAPDADGYDLVVHFHGNVQIVRESFEHAKINAAVAVINHGIRSAVYRDAYAIPGAFEELLARIEAGLVARGVQKPKLHRLALTSWSAGYAATEAILEFRRAPHAEEDPLDAIVALDGIHMSFVDGDPKRLNRLSVSTFIDAARAASTNQLLLVATHSNIDPGDYASTKRTQTFMLSEIGEKIQESPMLPLPQAVSLAAAKGAVRNVQRMIPTSSTQVGSLIIKGYEGQTADHHSAHLTQMAAVGLTELAARWAR
jgi:hypothetical protein